MEWVRGPSLRTVQEQRTLGLSAWPPLWYRGSLHAQGGGSSCWGGDWFGLRDPAGVWGEVSQGGPGPSPGWQRTDSLFLAVLMLTEGGLCGLWCDRGLRGGETARGGAQVAADQAFPPWHWPLGPGHSFCGGVGGVLCTAGYLAAPLTSTH